MSHCNVIELPRREKTDREKAAENCRVSVGIYSEYAEKVFDDILTLCQSAQPIQAISAIETVVNVLRITRDALKAEVISP